MVDGLCRHGISIPQQLERVITELAAAPEARPDVYSAIILAFYA
jgi:hypothetical protein